MPPSFRVPDTEFAAIVARCRSWRHVLREMGATTTSTTPVRSRARQLGLDTSHFTGQRLWSDDQLQAAIEVADTWNDVAVALGTPASNAKRHALRRGLGFAHLERRASVAGSGVLGSLVPTYERLRLAGESLAAAWLSLAGCGVGYVANQQPYDLLVVWPNGQQAKVQVKTTRWSHRGGRPGFD
jgi:hypothetical protein